jgi:uracil-DNA glycosylase
VSGAAAAAAGGGWTPVVEAWRASPAGQSLEAYLAQRRAAGATIYPPEPYRALQLTPLDQVKVVILGQDPYHGPGQAEGLSFSVPRGLKKLPPSLRNIYKELQRDLGLVPPGHGHLGAWAERGVLLLNTCLTVEDGAPASHARFQKDGGWEALTDALIKTAAADPAPKVFMLWGAHAQAKAPLIAAAGPQHLILQSNHPSPLSATRPPLPFLGNGHFSAAAAWLGQRGRPLDWQLPA